MDKPKQYAEIAAPQREDLCNILRAAGYEVAKNGAISFDGTIVPFSELEYDDEQKHWSVTIPGDPPTQRIVWEAQEELRAFKAKVLLAEIAVIILILWLMLK